MAGTRRFFVPAYVGHKGWAGARLDVEQDWQEMAELIEDSYRMIAAERLVAQLDERRAQPTRRDPS